MTIDWSLSYTSRREPVFASDIVATSQPLAAQAGLDMLRLDGNAIDAAICAAITLTVVEPCSNGIGSDAFAIVHDGTRLHGLNASGRSPALLDELHPALHDGIPAIGWIPVTVPGAVSSWVTLHERFGALDFETLFEPAIEYASKGFPVSRQTSLGWKRGQERYRTFDAWCDTFLRDGASPVAGAMMRLPDHAETLREIATTNGESFYRGAIARRIDETARAEGGLLRLEDMDEHTCDWIDPLHVDLGESTLYELPPNGQGIATLIAMKILLAMDVDLADCDHPDVLHMQIEAMKRAFAVTHGVVADPEVVVDSKSLLCDAAIERHIADITSWASDIDQETLPKYSSTVYLATGDASGMMVSFIQSNYEGFGSGIVVPGTGISLQNRGRGFSMERSHPNCVGPKKRPFHTIIPAFLDGTVRGPFGVMGGPMQPQGHVQVASRMVCAAQNPQAALDAPRWRLLGGRRVAIEPGFDDGVYARLRTLGHELEIASSCTVAFGGGQAIQRLGDGYVAASDQRRDGQAVGR